MIEYAIGILILAMIAIGLLWVISKDKYIIGTFTIEGAPNEVTNSLYNSLQQKSVKDLSIDNETGIITLFGISKITGGRGVTFDGNHMVFSIKPLQPGEVQVVVYAYKAVISHFINSRSELQKHAYTENDISDLIYQIRSDLRQSKLGREK